MVHKKKRKLPQGEEGEAPKIKQEKLEETQNILNEQEPDSSYKPQKRARLIVRNLPFKNLSENKLHELFSQYGEIKEISLLRKPNGLFVGCGFVEFHSRRSAAKAMFHVNGKDILGRQIVVDWALPKNTYLQKVQQLEGIEIKTENDSDMEEEKYSPDEERESNLIQPKKGETEDENVDEDEDEEDLDDEDEDEEDLDDEEEGSDDDQDEEEEDLEERKGRHRVKSNDVEEGKTVFVKNVPFSATNEDLKECFEKYGDIVYALICVDKLTEHSKGSGFIKFKDQESAQRSIRDSRQILLFEQPLEVTLAISRDKLAEEKSKKKAKTKDSRNLYLVREGVIMANSPAAETISAADMAKRLQIEQWKTQILRNLNMFVSKIRLVVHNLPTDFDDQKLRELFEKYSLPGAIIKEARVMTDRKQVDLKGNPISKEVGFVSFTKHEDALHALRQINNNPGIFKANRRPIVSFSIENRTILNIKQKRLEKSRAKLATENKMIAKGKELEKFNRKQRRFLRRKAKLILKRQEAKKIKAQKSDDKKESAKGERPKEKKKVDVKKIVSDSKEFAGVSAEPGKLMKLRSRTKLKQQAEIHKTVKKKLKTKQKKVKKLQEKDKLEVGMKNKKRVAFDNDKKFNDLIDNYKKKLVSVDSFKKWYESS